MVRKEVPTIHFRRKRTGKTDYKKRLKLLLSGKPRLVVRTSLNNIYIQIIEFGAAGDKVLASVNSSNLDKYGWKFSKSNLPCAYLLGFLMGKEAARKKISEAILDKGFNKKINGSKIFAVLKGVLDAGLNVPHSKEVFPTEERLSGQHISNHASKLKGDKTAFEKQFGDYMKKGNNPEDIQSNFKETKEKLNNLK